MQQGESSMNFASRPQVIGRASIVGKKEGEGPLGAQFDRVVDDPMFGTKTWEQAESAMQKATLEMALRDCRASRGQIRYLFAGDLLGQLIATSFGVMDLEIPLLGVYGACSTMGEALCLAAMSVDSGNADCTAALASSHFASAEKQFRFPLQYGNQRPSCATWTVTGAGAVVVGRESGYAAVTGATVGRIVDYGVQDSMNMGAAMAPAAADTIARSLRDFERTPEDYDQIITGDLGAVGQRILFDLLSRQGIDISTRHMDCGLEIYDGKSQDTHAGGSGCGCSAVLLCAVILSKLHNGEWKRVLFLPTGALLSPTSFNEGQSVPGIAHAVVLESPLG